MKLNLIDSIKFYFDYFFSKTILVWYLVKKNKLRIFVHETSYGLGKVLGTPLEKKIKLSINEVVTYDGYFNVRANTNDVTCVAPSFERTDRIYLKKIITKELLNNENTAFLDIGADIGLYTVLVGTQFKEIDLFAFEPNQSTFELLSKNTKINKIDKKSKLLNYALGSKESEAIMYFDEKDPGSSSLKDNNSKNYIQHKVHIKPLDAQSLGLEKYKNLIIKIDVEGFEKEVLGGAIKTIRSHRVILLIEDFITEELDTYLISEGFSFLAKKSPYNSWWIYEPK